MFAKNLEHVLAQLCEGGDLSHVDPREVSVRFDALRAFGRLPRGRNNREQRLNSAEIAAAIFGLVPANPKWAGHAAAVLANLRPVGGIEASFRGAANLTGAVERLLADASARVSLVRLVLSVAEYATNCNGSATLSYQEGESRRRVAFVSEMAVSLLQPGAERTVDMESAHAPVSRGAAFNRTFFERIDSAVARGLASPGPPAGDGSEYDAEEAQQTRYKALRVGANSRFLNIGVDTQVTWPNREMIVEFDRFHLILMPKTREHAQSIHIDLHANQLSDREARTVINRFLSILAWCDDQFAVTQDGWTGNPVPVAVLRRDLAFATAHHWVFDRQISSSDEVRRALALYREGRNAEEAALVGYAVLSYFKIIEIRHSDGPKAKRWIARNFAAVRAADHGHHQFDRFLRACGDEAPEEYIWTACRVAVAHASVKRPLDADEADEIVRLHEASYVLRQLARFLISQELGVSDQVHSGD